MSIKFEVVITDNVEGVGFNIEIVDDVQATDTERYVTNHLINEIVKAAGELSEIEGDKDAI